MQVDCRHMTVSETEMVNYTADWIWTVNNAHMTSSL